jgi:TupA-like ATPgrasp
MLPYRVKQALAWFIPDRIYVKLAFLARHGWLPRTPPVTFNECLYHLKSSGELANYQRYADKLAVRDHVARTIGAKYLVPLHATAERLTRELWHSLPESFILKANHGSQWNRIVRNKSADDYLAAAAQADGWLKRNFYYVRRERQYKNIKPTLMIEELLKEPNEKYVKDYMFFCFHGIVRFILVMHKGETDYRYYYDRSWNRLDITREVGRPEGVPRPDDLDEMIRVAETLAEDFRFVRADLYSVGKRIYFSELTFVPAGGSGRFSTIEFEECAGRLWAGEEVELTPFHCRQEPPAGSLEARETP